MYCFSINLKQNRIFSKLFVNAQSLWILPSPLGYGRPGMKAPVAVKHSQEVTHSGEEGRGLSQA